MSLARRDGHHIFFIDNYLQPSSFIEDGYLSENSIALVAIYANTICYRDTLRMFTEMQELRERGAWKGRIAVGGPHTSAAPETIPEYIDHVVQGEGEKSFMDILNGTATSRVLQGERLKDLDSLPFQPWDIFASLPYDYTCLWLDKQPFFTMNTSRGCPFGCSFCSVKSVWGKRYTYQSPDRIIAEIEYLVKDFGAKGVYFREDHFTLNLQRTHEFCEKLIAKKLNIWWGCETRVDVLSEEMLKQMSAAGCRAVYLGVESGSQRMLDILNKNITVEQIENAIIWSKKCNIKVYCSLITGIPGETYEDYLKTKKLMMRLKPDVYSFGIFVGIPTSPLYDNVIKKGIYEYIDDLGLVYLPGFDIKMRYFRNRDSREIVDYEFKQRTDYDLRLLRQMRRKERWSKFGDLIRLFLPGFLLNCVKCVIRRMTRAT